MLAAIQSLADNNIYGLRFAQISKLAGVPQPLIDYHFPSLEALLNEMIAFQLEKYKYLSIEAIEANASKPRRALEAYIRVIFELAGSDPGFRAVWSAYFHLTTVSPNFATSNRSARQTGTERLATLIAGVVRSEGRKHAGKKSAMQALALAIQGIMTGFSYMAATELDGEFMGMADLAVKASFQLLEVNFPPVA